MTAIYFDLDGTLIEYDSSFTEIYDATLRELGVIPHSESEYGEVFFDVLGTVDDPFATAIARTSVDVNPTAFSETLVAKEIENVSARTGAHTLLESLSGTCSLGVLTNGVSRVQRGKLHATELTDYFDSIVVSGEVGVRKPEADIYRIAERRLPAHEYVFVANDLDRDVRPAIECGWYGILFGDETSDDVPSVQQFDEIPHVLDQKNVCSGSSSSS